MHSGEVFLTTMILDFQSFLYALLRRSFGVPPIRPAFCRLSRPKGLNTAAFGSLCCAYGRQPPAIDIRRRQFCLPPKLVFRETQMTIRELKPMDPENLFIQRLSAGNSLTMFTVRTLNSMIHKTKSRIYLGSSCSRAQSFGALRMMLFLSLLNCQFPDKMSMLDMTTVVQMNKRLVSFLKHDWHTSEPKNACS